MIATCSNKNYIIIVGAGKSGYEAYEYFKDCNILYFVDNDCRKHGKKIHGITIISFEVLSKQRLPLCLDIVIAIPASRAALCVVDQLKTLGCNNYNFWSDIKIYWPDVREFCTRNRSIYPYERRSLYEGTTPRLELVEKYVLKSISESDQYENRWSTLVSQYKRIVIQKIRVSGIGELLMRYFAMYEDNIERDTMYVYLPIMLLYTTRVANEYVLSYLGICNRSDTLFWLYVLDKHIDRVDVSEIDKYISRQYLPIYMYKAYSIASHFNEDEIAEGERQMYAMGIDKNFVCLNARNSQYNKNTLNRSTSDIRDSSFSEYGKIIDYLGQNNMLTVKMGRFESPIPDIPNCIDYAGRYGNDFMDLYLFSKCEFMISGNSGIICFAMLFTKPLLMINVAPISFGAGASRYTEKDIYMPQKHYDVRQGKYMTLREIFEFEKAVSIDSKYYQDHGITLFKNTEDDILEATMEIMSRIDGTWVDTREDIENYERYLEIYREMDEYQCNNPQNWLGGAVPWRPAATFLRKNKFMLE